MAKEIRLITASADLVSTVDRGAQVDSEIKTLTVEDKAIKAKITGFIDDEFKEGETNLKLAGTKAEAVVTAVEKYTLNASAPSYPELRKAVDSGLLQGIVDKSQQLAVPPEQIVKAAEALKKAGVPATIVESFSVNAAAYRESMSSEVSSPEQTVARRNLKACVSREVAFRVKYEKMITEK